MFLTLAKKADFWYTGKILPTPNTHMKHRGMLMILTLVTMIAPTNLQAVGVPYEQEFTLTAYYSPLPDQCCYVKGSYEADKILNGDGTHGADGTPVYPGMIAAPPSYAFGTRIELPGLGTLTVHDRGGAIQEWDDSHRLDVWVGQGEEGLARALEFGVQHIRGMVYPNGTDQPTESFAMESLPSPEDRLKPYLVADAGLLDIAPAYGEHGLSVRMLQEHLRDVGYFDHEITDFYGDVTRDALAAFIADMQMNESADSLSQKTAAYIVAAHELRNAPSPIAFVDAASSASDIMKAQRTLRFMGYYRGRTDGAYSSVLFNAILAYQRDQQLVGDAQSPGAGRIGPLTKNALDTMVLRRRATDRAQKILVFVEVRDKLEGQGALLASTMQVGANGKNVRLLQEFLASQGFFPAEEINGNFGPLTEEAVASYQIARELLPSRTSSGIGTIGPVTLHTIRQEQVKHALLLVRAEGWSIL